MAVGKTDFALGSVRTQESGESPWLEGGDVESQLGGTQESGESPWFGGGLDGEDQGSPRCAGSLRVKVSKCDPSKGCMPLGIHRVEETKGLIDGMGTVGLHRAKGHNGSIEDHVA